MLVVPVRARLGALPEAVMPWQEGYQSCCNAGASDKRHPTLIWGEKWVEFDPPEMRERDKDSSRGEKIGWLSCDARAWPWETCVGQRRDAPAILSGLGWCLLPPEQVKG